MYDIDGNYIPGFGVPVKIKKPSKKTKKNEKQVLTWDDFKHVEYEWVYLPDEYLPAYELRKIIYTTNSTNNQDTGISDK